MSDGAEAEFGIRQLHARYADAVWRRDVGAFVDCFATNGEWKIAGRHATGPEQIGSQFVALTAASERVLMFTGTPLLDIDAGGVTTRTPVTELIKLQDGRGLRTLGVYYDWIAEQDGRWRFRRRHWALHYYGAPDLSDPLQPGPEYGPPPGMPAVDEQTQARASAPS